jgi:polysaccharide export outer membrane protein
MYKLIYLYLILTAFFSFTSCSNKQYQALFQEKKALSADTSVSKNAVSYYEYRIQPQDILQIRNLQDTKYIANLAPVSANTAGGNAAQGETFQVEEDGTVKLPALGRVKVVGLTRVDAQKMIEDMYAKSLLVNPIIELKIINLKVTLLGEIKGQGNIPLVKDRTTLVEVIGEAGGLTPGADEKNIKIIRGTEKDPKVIEVDLEDIRSINDPKTILQSGDIIYVSQNKRAARNDNLQNFSVILQPALILFNTALIIFTLVRK